MRKVPQYEYDEEIFGQIQTLDTNLLTRVVRCEIDLNQLAVLELASRGLDEYGQWIGFDKAKEKFVNVN